MIATRFKKFLLTLPRSVKRGLVLCSDIFICGLSVWLAFGLRLDQWGYFHTGQWIVFICAALVGFPTFVFFGLYRTIFRYVGSTAFLTITRVFTIYSCINFCLFTLIGIQGIPRSIGVIQPILLFIGIGISRYFVRYWLGSINVGKRALRREKKIALIYGAGSAGRRLASGLLENGDIVARGFIDDDTRLQGCTINGIEVFPNRDLQLVISQQEITDVILAIPSADQVRRTEIIASLSGLGVRVRNFPGLINIASGRVKISDLHELDVNDLLGRPIVPPRLELLQESIRNKVILVTGAGGSIGSELCRQLINLSPKSLILIDTSEHSLYLIYEELKNKVDKKDIKISGELKHGSSSDSDAVLSLIPRLASVRDHDAMLKIFKEYKPSTVFHAAAYKHVPMVEQNPSEGIHNNLFGTLVCAQVSLECGVSRFILISTDKAVRPTNIMGASKRIAEQVLQAMSEMLKQKDCLTKFSMVRFGNVLGSSGSVAPLFSAQIAAGGPITLTHPDVTRYFMTIPEAAQLVIQAGAMSEGGDVFVLDMGEPVRIFDLATKMIYLSGLLVKDEDNPNGDIEIQITGLRPGEKLYEEILIGDNPQHTDHPKIMRAYEEFMPWDDLQKELQRLKTILQTSDRKQIEKILKKLVPGYQPNNKMG